MPRNDEQMLTLAQVCEMQPGDQDNPAWINPGFTATVDTIEQKKTAKGNSMWVCALSDPDNGARAEMALFTAPKFSASDSIEVTGNGMKRDEFKGKAKIGTGKGTVIRTLSGPAPARQAAPVTRAAYHDQPGPMANEAPVPAAARQIYGGTVGGALKIAMETFRYIYTPADLREMIKTPAFHAALYEFTSDLIRIQLPLEAGRVAPAIKTRCTAFNAAKDDDQAQSTGGRSDPPTPATRPQAGPGGSAYAPSSVPDEDCPF
jgi:hypothetical protein